MLTRVAVLGQPGPELMRIANKLRNPLKFYLREFTSLLDVEGLAKYPFEILIMRVESFSSRNVPMLIKARERFDQAGLITIASEVDPSARYQVRELYRHKLILEKIELRDLCKVIDMLSGGSDCALRLHPRIPRSDDAELVDEKSGRRLRGRFVDFAQMGARFALDANEPVLPAMPLGMRFRLEYRSTAEPGRVHRVESKVIWQKMTTGIFGTVFNGPEQMLGLRFVAAL